MMKKIEAIINPSKIEDVKNSLLRLGISEITLSEVEGYGHQKQHRKLYRMLEYEVAFVSKLKLEMVVSDTEYETILHAIQASAKTGKIGDGKIFVYDLQQVVPIFS